MNSREQDLQRLGSAPFDLIVVGGGITGCGIARDAALRGLRVALVEKLDFAAGTSSKSTKLIHGGLRYLEMGELGLVFESVNERARLMKLARHLVRPLPFLVLNYKGDPRWLLTLDIGLWIYDALCLFRSYRQHRALNARRTLALEPALRADALNGSILYYDASTDDARLTLENAIDAKRLGAVMLNHVKAERLLKDAAGRVTGVAVKDTFSGATIEASATVVVSATGPWTDEVREQLGQRGLLKPTKGVHIVVDSKRLPTTHALMMASPRDKRVVFSIPFGLGRTVVGTTDTFFSGSPDEVNPTNEDIEYLLETANAYYPGAKLAKADVLSTWSGLRPLLKPDDSGASASEVSREHMLLEQPGLLTIAGGKLTTYRLMAMEVVDRAMVQLGKTVKSTTASQPLPGAVGIDESDEQFLALVKSLISPSLDEASAVSFAETFGTRAAAVLNRGKIDPTAAERIDPELPFIYGQVDEAIEHEFALTLDDMLSRRIPLILRARDQGLGAARKVAERMAKQLHWSAEQLENEINAYRAVVAESRAFRAPVERP